MFLAGKDFDEKFLAGHDMALLQQKAFASSRVSRMRGAAPSCASPSSSASASTHISTPKRSYPF